jgi:N-acetylglucosamine-6-phosphate deacetylase
MRLGVEAALVGGRLVPGDVDVDDGLVRGYGLGGADGRGIAAPGFVDLQVNGFAGVDFANADAAGYQRAGAALLETGVTSYLPTFITAPEEQLVAALQEVPSAPSGPKVLGVHLEGPFLAPGRLGAHPPSARRDPDAALLERLLAAGPVRMMTLATELPGAEALIDALHARGVTASSGHTDATAEQANPAFDRGVRTVTHLFNAMRPFTHRDAGIAGAALTRDDVIVQVILDGIHLAPTTAALVWRAAAGRTALVTDAVAAARAPAGHGSYTVGDVEVRIRHGAARRPNGVLAGSTLTMIDAVRNLRAAGASLEDSLQAASTVPARVLGLARVGRLDVGLPPDIVVIDDTLEVVRTLVGTSP